MASTSVVLTEAMAKSRQDDPTPQIHTGESNGQTRQHHQSDPDHDVADVADDVRGPVVLYRVFVLFHPFRLMQEIKEWE